MSRISQSLKQITFAAAILLAFYLSYQIVHALSFLRSTVNPEIYFNRMAVCFAFFFLPIFGGWFAFRFMGGASLAFFAAILVLFVGTVANSTLFLWFIAEYGILCFVLYRLDEYYANAVAGLVVDREKYQNEKNDLSVNYKTKGEGISIYFEKYSTYYHLRKLAEELVSSLSVAQLSEMIAKRCSEFIPRGDIVLISLADPEGKHLSVIASKPIHPQAPSGNKKGDAFDFWVIRSRKQLIVNDTHQDFRFDVAEMARQATVRSLIIVPLLHEGRVIGTLRFNSSEAETFTNDDLRLLDAISTLASSALSNAMLFEKTEELAIKDSLTGFYIRRYFYERLKHEHRRFLLSKRPLSLLMCDLDHFKACNDKYGHGAGDLMLIKFCEVLRESIGDAFAARYGGEEFVVILTDTAKNDAVVVAEKIRENVDKTIFTIRREKIKMTISIGVASIPEDTLDIQALIQKSDEALYRAKREGRNRVCLSD